MALTPEELATLRQWVSEPDDSNGWTDQRFNDVAVPALQPNDTYDLRAVAASVWASKAASYVELVNVSESGSQRSLSQAFDHAVEMGKQFGGTAPTTPSGATGRPRSTKIVRPTRT